MMKHHLRKTTRLLTALLFVVAGAAAVAQDIDPRARELLEGLGGSQEEVRSLEATTITTAYMDGETFTSATHLVIDYDNRRLAAIVDTMGMQTTIRVMDGQTTMVMMGMTIPAPPGTGDQFEAMFDQGGSGDLLDSAVRATFDGPVRYGDLLAGDQVTYEGDAALMNAPEAQVVHYVFGPDGALLGTHMDTSDGEMLMVFDEPVTDLALPAMDMKMYMQTDGQWRLFSEMRYENVVINGEIDESLFK